MERLTEKVEQTIIKVILNARGAEICGFLLDNENGQQSFLSIENRLASRNEVFVSETDMSRAQRIIQTRGLHTIAWVHSHHTGTVLSEVDRQGLAESSIPWIVVCLTDAGLQVDWYWPPSIG